jgi:hypothetical protein
MKYLLLSILLITPQLISTRVIIDLENEGREGSEYIKDLQWATDKDIAESKNIPGQTTISEINNEVRFSVPIEPKNIAGGISKDTPTMKLVNADGTGQEGINYSLSQNPSDECLMLNYPEVKSDSDISCTYSNGYSVLTKSFPNKGYKKEISIGKYVIALTQEGKFDVGLIQDNQVFFDNSFQSQFYKEGFKQFENIVIKDFFINPMANAEASGNFGYY